MPKMTDEEADAPIVIEEVRQLLQKEMAEKGTLAVTVGNPMLWNTMPSLDTNCLLRWLLNRCLG